MSGNGGIMKEDNMELNQKLAEWAGFKLKPTTRSLGTIDWPDYSWHTPLGEPLWGESDLPDFTASLDACFEWLVPKLLKIKEFPAMSFEFYWDDFHGHGMIECRLSPNQFAFAGTPALALCLAIEKLIDGESK